MQILQGRIWWTMLTIIVITIQISDQSGHQNFNSISKALIQREASCLKLFLQSPSYTTCNWIEFSLAICEKMVIFVTEFAIFGMNYTKTYYLKWWAYLLWITWEGFASMATKSRAPPYL